VVPEIFRAHTKKSEMALKTEPYLRAVIIIIVIIIIINVKK